MEPYRYDAFISYRHVPHDKAVAKKLHTLLETYKIPSQIAKATGKKKFQRIFRDEEELPIAASLSDSLTTALEQSEWLIVIASPDWRASTWCNAEVDEFIRMGRRDHILVVLAAGSPETSFPLQLMTIETEEGVKATEPLAANILAPTTEESLKRLQTEKLRIIAPMLGVNFDDLRRRALQRKIRTAIIIAAAVLVALVGIGTFVIIETQKQAQLRLEAERERAEKELERAEKEKQELLKGMANISELLQKAKSENEKQNKLSAMQNCLEALDVSDTIQGAQREVIIDALREYSYFGPFEKIADFDNANVRITDMTASPDGKRLAGVVNKNSIAIVNVIEGTVEHIVSVGGEMLLEISFSPDGKYFAANCEKAKMAVCWRTEDATEVARYVSKNNEFYQIAHVLFLDNDVLLIQDMAELFRLPIGGEPQLIYTVGDYNGSYDRNNNLFTRSFGQIDERMTFYTMDYSGASLAISEDRQKILVSDCQGHACVTIIDPYGKEIWAMTDVPGLFSEVYYMSPDGRYVACTSYCNYFAAWDVEKKEMLYAYNMGGEKGASFSNISFTRDGESFAFTTNGDLLVVSTANAQPKYYVTFEQTSYVPTVNFVLNDEFILFENQSLFILRAEDGSAYDIFKATDSDNYTAAQVIHDGTRLFVARSGGTAEVYSTPQIASVINADDFSGTYETSEDRKTSGVPAFSIVSNHSLQQGFKDSTALTDLSSTIYSSEDGVWVVVAHADGAMEIFNKDTGAEPKFTLWEFQIKAECVRFFENTLVASDVNRNVVIFDLLENKVIRKYESSNGAKDMAISKDGKFLLVLPYAAIAASVYTLDGDTRLFLLYSSANIVDGGFTADGTKVVVKDENGKYVIGDLLLDESALIKRAKELTGKE